jgi:hypothetical protein
MPLHGYPLAPLVAAMRRPTDLSPTCCRRNRPTPLLNTTAAALSAEREFVVTSCSGVGQRRARIRFEVRADGKL